ncbi:DNA-methyltransferase [Brucella intermedia]|uniref:DNA-methyltransferase n=1 Tax=Brucella intermedia TaxID=94625 RepID=UPI00124E156E|nr:site-specific DNA-methyltransferase [Brucella intermedia]KAB2693897.1 site-specific DNA-methyltransferase [Brucella intermedia]
MTISLLDGRVEIIVDDVMAALARMSSDSVDCVVTSPPYWGLRSYIADGDPLKPLEIGLEPTLASHLETMVAVFEQVRRVLKPTGTCWINYGDCYATTPNGKSAADYKADGTDDRTFRDKPFSTISGGIKPKDLLMIPNRLAIALQDAGWWVRSEIIWGKSNPMPDSSGAYRPSAAHEKIFMLTKSDDGDVWPPELAERCILAGCPKDGVVLDPFGGAGTTGLVAARHNRRAMLIELNPEYADIARRRIEREWRVIANAPSATTDHGPLFSAKVL